LRIGTWNCRQRLDTKRDAVDELACDVLVLPECSTAVRLASEPGVSFAWRGEYAPKGLGVFGLASIHRWATGEVSRVSA
jgi:hypothetical protein